MTQATKIFKVNGGDAFIEVGESYIRMGVGSQTFFLLEKNSITGGSNTMNWQMDPSRMTYNGILANIGVIGGLSPVGPKYKLNMQAIKALVNTYRNVALVTRAVGISPI